MSNYVSIKCLVMKVSSILLACMLICTQGAFALFGPPPLTEEDGKMTIRLGCEWMAAYQTHYIYRGEDFGANVAEMQLAGGVAISNNWNLNGQIFGVSHLDDGNYSQWSVTAAAHYFVTDECVIGPSVTGQFYTNSPFRSGVEPGFLLIWNPNLDWSFNSQISYDTGQKGAYFENSVTWQPLIMENVAWATTASVGVGFHYQDKTGMRELMLKTGPLIGINAYWRVRPYVGFYHGEGKKSFNKTVVGAVLSISF